MKSIITLEQTVTEEERRVLKACADDDFIRPIVVTLMCIAMRRKAVCLLDWCAVDMINGFIEVDPGKGGNRTCIPIFPLLRGELERRIPRSTGYVFPDQAKMYLTNPDGITWRIQQVLCEAGFSRHGAATSSDHNLSIPHPTDQRMINVRGAHSFRTTWVTLAILNGVSIDIVRKVTGHRTVDVVVQNYLQPGRKQIKRALADKMPLLLDPGPASRYSEQSMVQVHNGVRSQLAAMTTASWSTTRDQLLGMIETHIINRDNHAA
ncbi:MAG: tyrosine-type recombinase/integrase [Opitutaceae bacterium]|nr:tyrosine-type recombinase/integrase [Opitutaceae bacterium]